MTSEAERKAAEQLRRKRQRLQLLLMLLDEWMMDIDTQGMQITNIRVRSPLEGHGEFLVIVKARFEGRPYVGFHSAASVEDGLIGALERIRNNDLKWREDQPYKEGA